ncbi:tetratricopeptide repeat protein [Candidatus Bathyarchaeota archaeon]|nr:tetratricopeptide repeat protein [Candidatus Bathyarchaeota archaeon]
MLSDKSRVVPGSSPVAVREIQLIDRAKEMEVSRKAVDRAIRGEGSVVFLHGEAGIGKTRLARELGAYARSKGMQVLSGRCPALFRMDGVPPYILWEEVIKDYLETSTPEQLFRVIGAYPVEVSKLVPELKHKLRTFPQSFPLSPEHSRDRLFEAVSQFITNISRETPLLVILDDLQWTDRSSLLLLHYLARGVYKESLLILGAYRETYIDEKHPLSPVLTELNRERLLQSVPLKRLSFDDVSEMIKRILEQDEVPKEFCRLVYERTRGNPFFVEEVIRSLKEEETIYLEAKRWKVKEVSKIEFPKTVKSVLKKRIGRLDDETQTVLTIASFVGKDFTFEALRAVTQIEENKLLDIMDKILKAGLIKQQVFHGEDVCSFADILVRDVVAEDVSPLRRKKLHGEVALALEKVYEQKIDEHFGELALHFLEGGEKRKALDYFLKAGAKAVEVYANIEAVSYFQSAYAILEEREGALEEKADVLEKLGNVRRLVGEYAACLSSWNDALLLRKQLHENEKLSRLHRKMANLFWETMGEAKKAEEHHEKALKILKGEPESVELATLYEDMAHMYYRIGDLAEALSWAEKSLELAKKLNAREVIASSYASLGTILGFTGNMKKARECFETGLKQALDNGFMEAALRIYNNLPISLTAEENEKRLELLEKGFELAKKVGHISYQTWIGANLANMLVNMGNMDRAVQLLEESVELDRKTGNLHLSVSTGFLGLAYQVLGEWDKSEQHYKESLKVTQKQKEFQGSAGIQIGFGGLYFDKEEYGKAKKHIEKGIEIFEKAGAKTAKMYSSPILIRTYLELGKVEKAKNLIQQVQKFALKLGDRELVANANVLRAMQFRTQRKWEDSIEYFEKSLQESKALNARRWNAYNLARGVLYEYARTYLERGQEGDREKAQDLLNQALEIFQEIGAKKDIEKTRLKLANLETGRKASPVEPMAVAALPHQITTGYRDLDDLLNGGIPRDYAVALTSPSSDERDLLVRRFLEAGARNGQTTFHVIAKAAGTQKLAEAFQSHYYLFVCNPEADSIVKNLPNVYKLKGVENLTEINIAMASALRALDKPPKNLRRACIEIVSDVLLQHHAVQTRKWLNALLPKLRSKGFTTLAVMDPEMHPPQEVKAILGLFDGEISIYRKAAEKGRAKFLKVERMTNQEYSEDELHLRKERLTLEKS